MLIAEIILLIIFKKYSAYLENYLNEINLFESFRTYSYNEETATFISMIIIFWMVFSSFVILYFAYLKSEQINPIFGFIILNSIYSIISILLVIICIHKRNINLIKNYKIIPWNQSLLFAYILYMSLFSTSLLVKTKRVIILRKKD
ncbi:hypothetical protein H8356DRAFT_1304636 [Neocallimastix lanati (nom. inval.)]|nr:hypothetical protein H8356DRAFT_1304636 [Neocallimastix sp. JGI-2020a]